MTTISLNPEKMTAATIAIFDLMSDGRWHDNSALIAHGAATCAVSERDEALKNGRRVRRKALASGKELTDEDLVTSGAKDMVRNRLMIAVRSGRLERNANRHRMNKATCLAWMAVRPHLSQPRLTIVDNAQRVETATTTPNVTAASATPKSRTKVAVTATKDSEIITMPTTTKPAVEQVDAPASLHLVTDVTDVTDSIDSVDNIDNVDSLAEGKPAKGRKSKHYAADLVFGGIPEAEGWADAPLSLKSRVHFRTENGEVPLAALRAALPAGTEVGLDEGTGLYRVDCEHGTGNEIRDFIRDWCEDNGLKAKALRAEHSVRRRTLTDLDARYLSDLCEHYNKYGQNRLRRHNSTLQYHFSDPDDQKQQVYEWVLEAASRYDDTSGVPFGAFLAERLSKWVHDLNRNKYGRILSDTELKYQRAMQQFVTEHGRKPSEKELAQAMGQEIAVFRKNAQVVSTLQGLRNIGTLDVAPGESEVHLPDEDRCEDRYSGALNQSLLSQVMTKSCDVDAEARGKLSSKPNVLGWFAWYASTWGGKNKTELANELSTSMRNIGQYSDQVRDRMRARQGDLAGA